TKTDVTRLLSGTDPANKEAIATQLARLTVFSDLSPTTRAALEKTLRANSAAVGTARVSEPLEVKAGSAPTNVAAGYAGAPAATRTVAPQAPTYVTELLTLLLGSPEFQKR